MTANDPDDVLIGEGVVLEAASATVGVRIISGLIDYGMLVLAFSFSSAYIISPLLADPSLENSARNAIVTASILGFLIVLPVTIETLSRGSSLGRKILGIRIVRDDGGPIGLRHAMARTLAGLIEVWVSFGTIATITSLVSPRSKRIGDMLAGTYALRLRAPRAQVINLEVPPGLRTWSETADIRRLPDGLALSARQFLIRAPQLSAATRAELGASYSEQLMPYVAPLPTTRVHPEAFILGVLATRRDRELALAQERQRVDAESAVSVQRLPFGVADVLD